MDFVPPAGTQQLTELPLLTVQGMAQGLCQVPVLATSKFLPSHFHPELQS